MLIYVVPFIIDEFLKISLFLGVLLLPSVLAKWEVLEPSLHNSLLKGLCHVIFGVFKGNLQLIMSFKLEIVMWNSNLLIVTSQKRPLSRRFAIDFKNVGPNFFKITQMQSVSIQSICVHPGFSFLLLYFCFVNSLSDYCTVSFYFSGSSGVIKLHHFA